MKNVRTYLHKDTRVSLQNPTLFVGKLNPNLCCNSCGVCLEGQQGWYGLKFEARKTMPKQYCPQCSKNLLKASLILVESCYPPKGEKI